MASRSVKKDKEKLQNQAFKTFLDKLKAVITDSPIASAIALSVLLCLLLNAIVGFLGWQKFVIMERQHQLEKFTEHNARVAASNVANYMHGSYKKLEFFKNSSSLVTALRYRDPAGILEIQKALKNSFPKADAIRIFAVGQAKVNLSGDPPLRFAEVEIIRQAENRELVVPEAISVDGDAWKINIVAPVSEKATTPVLGTILVTLPIDELYHQLRLGLEGKGKVSLYQTFNDKPRLMGSFGRGELFKAQRISVPESPWQVEFTASQELYEATQIDFALLLIVATLISLTSIVVFIFIGLAIGRSVHKKQQSLLDTYSKMEINKHRGTDNRDALLGVKLRDEDKEILGLKDADVQAEAGTLDIDDSALADAAEVSIPAHIFRSYDIRGIAEQEITPQLALAIGKALASEAMEQGESYLILARDARVHSPILMENLIRGVLSTGCNVINIGTVPTPLLYFATEVLEQCSSGVMVTASHSPAEFNGFKVVMKGQPRTEEDIKSIRARIIRGEFRQGIGKEEALEIVDRYVDTIFSDVALAGDISIVIDAGNGVTGKVAPRLFEELGCQVTPLHCNLDGTFPHHGPDPSKEENLQDLIKKVKETGADLGVAFDGDGDRLAVVTPTGNIIWPDRLLMLFAKDILARNPGADVVFDVKSSRQLNSVISSNGGRPIMWKTGHAPMRAKLVETGALLGGEFSGHIFIKDRWFGFDDGMYAAARLIEIMSLRDENLDEIFAEFPTLAVTPEYRFAIAEDKKFELVQNIIKHGDFGDAKLITLDGLRVEYPYGWGLVRASNTGAELTMRFEAESKEQLHELKALFTREIRKIDETIKIQWPSG